jgi:hypothetical protein
LPERTAFQRPQRNESNRSDNPLNTSTTSALAEHWRCWRRDVVYAIRETFRGLLDHVNEDDVDWEAWRPLYDEGRSPRAAVARAFLRDL